MTKVVGLLLGGRVARGGRVRVEGRHAPAGARRAAARARGRAGALHGLDGGQLRVGDRPRARNRLGDPVRAQLRALPDRARVRRRGASRGRAVRGLRRGVGRVGRAMACSTPRRRTSVERAGSWAPASTRTSSETILVVAIVFGVGLGLVRSWHPLARAAAFAGAAISTVGLFLTLSRGALFGLAVAILVAPLAVGRGRRLAAVVHRRGCRLLRGRVVRRPSRRTARENG